MNWIYVATTILLTCDGQLVLKWQVNLAGDLPVEPIEKIKFLVSIALRPWMITVFLAAGLAYVSWMAAMSKFSISQVYPFMGLTFIVVMFASAYFFNEDLTILKLVGTSLVVFGLALIAQ